MRLLGIAGQDIHAITFALIDGATRREQTLEASPETYLVSLQNTLHEWGVSTESIEGVAVVSGPGSFTASRVSTIIANAIGFVLGIPIIELKNPDRRPLSELLSDVKEIPKKRTGEFVTPLYDRPPHITLPA